MIFLPKCVIAACNLAARDGTRYAMQAVRLQELDADADPWFRMDVTDGRRLAIIRGSAQPPERAGLIQMPEDLPPGIREGLVPATELAAALKGLGNGQDRLNIEPVLAVHLGEIGAYLASHQGLRRTPYIEGRHPDFASVLPKGPALVSFTVNPMLLIDLLRAAAAICGSEHPRVAVLFWSSKDPIGVIAKGSNGLTFDSLLMPLSPDQPVPPPKVHEPEEEEPEEEEEEGEETP